MLAPQADQIAKWGPGEAIAVDVIGPIPTGENKMSLILTCVDTFTRYGGSVSLTTSKHRTYCESVTTILDM